MARWWEDYLNVQPSMPSVPTQVEAGYDDEAEYQRILKALGYDRPAPEPQMEPSPGFRTPRIPLGGRLAIPSLKVGGGTLDNISASILASGVPQGRNTGEAVAGGFLRGFARSRAGQAQGRQAQYEAQAKAAQEHNDRIAKFKEQAAMRRVPQAREQAPTAPATPRGFGARTMTLPDGTVVPMTAAMANAQAKKQGVIPTAVSVSNSVSPDVRRQAQSIAKAIVAGRQPPKTTNMGRGGLAGEVRRILEEENAYPLATAEQDFDATKTFLRSANNPLSIRMRGSAATAFESTRLIDRLSKQLKDADPELRGGLAPLNRARLAIAMNGPDPKIRALARQLDGQIATVVFELGNVNMGGNSPTDQGMKRAQKELSSDWDENTLLAMTELARENLRIRLNSINNVGAYTTKGIDIGRVEAGEGQKREEPVAKPSGGGMFKEFIDKGAKR